MMGIVREITSVETGRKGGVCSRQRKSDDII